MSKTFAAISRDWAKAKTELIDFKRTINSKDELDENANIYASLEQKQQLCLLFGKLFSMPTPTHISYRLPIIGEYATDIVLVDKNVRKVCLIELEAIKKDSIFVKRGRENKYWGSKLEEGFGQVIDWMSEIDIIGEKKRNELFKIDKIDHLIGCVIIGRKSHIKEDSELRRLAYRQNQLSTAKNFAFHLKTYDEVICELEYWISDHFCEIAEGDEVSLAAQDS
jgi:hypothetical protein